MLIEILIVLVVVGGLLALLRLAPDSWGWMKQAATIIVVVFVLVWLLRLVGRSGVLPF